MAEEYIWVVTDAETTGGRDGGVTHNPFTNDTPRSSQTLSRPGIPVSVEKLEQGVADFLQTIGRVLKQAQARATELGGMELDEIELSVQVNGEGELSLLGSGAKMGGSGTMTLRFKRSSSS